MKKILSLFIATLVYWYIGTLSPVHAEAVSLSISPPVVEILLSPNKQVVQTFTIKNLSNAPVELTPTLHTATPIDDFGHVRVDPSPVSPAAIPLVAKLTPRPFGEVVSLAAGESLTLTLELNGASVDAPIDTYLALVVEASPPTLESITTKTTPAISGLLLVTLTPSGVIPAEIEIEDFNLPLIHDTALPFTLRPVIKNKSGTMIRPGAELTILDMKGKTIYHADVSKNLVLKESSREFGPFTWNPQWSNLGPHRIQLRVSTEGGTKLSEIERVVWFLPLRALIMLVVLSLIIMVILWRRKKITPTLLIIFGVALLTPPTHAQASLINVADTLSTSTLSTIETPIKVQHRITFTPQVASPNGSFRILLPADPENSNDGVPDDAGYDFNSHPTVAISPASGYFFAPPKSLSAGSPGCTVPLYFHCFIFSYTGSGPADTPLTVTIGNQDGSGSLLAPISDPTHTPGNADVYPFVVRHYSASDDLVEYTIGNIGHVEGVRVVATVKGAPEAGLINVISLPYLPATVAQLFARPSLALILLTMLALGIGWLLFLLWRRKWNLLLLDIHGDPIKKATVYHSIPDTRARFTRVMLARHEPVTYYLEKSDRGRLYIRHLSRYSTLTIRLEHRTYLLSLSVKRSRYTLILD